MVIYQYSKQFTDFFCIDPEWDLPKQKIANILDFCSQVGRICENKGKLSTKKLAKLRHANAELASKLAKLKLAKLNLQD